MQNNKKISSKGGFTIAETLLTLMIAGIIAAIIIPSAERHIEKVALHAAFLKAYSTAELAINDMMSKNLGTLTGADFVIDGNPYLRNKTFVVNSFNGHYRCGGTSSHPAARNKCWHTKWRSAQPNSYQSDWWGGFTTYDGMLWMYRYGANKSCTSTVACFSLEVDVNGFKNPNTEGRDIFHIVFFADKILPRGAKGTDIATSTCASGPGWGSIGASCAYYELANKPKVGYLKDY